MIKKLKNFICKLFNIKSCKCDDVDEHIEYFTKVPEPEVPVHKDHCDGHSRFRKSCLNCLEVVNG